MADNLSEDIKYLRYFLKCLKDQGLASTSEINIQQARIDRLEAALSAPAVPAVMPITFVRFEYNGVRLKTPHHEFIVETPKQTPAVPVIEGLDEAISIVSRHQDWRRGAEIEMENPKVLGVSIDKILEAARAYAALPKGELK